MERLQKLTTRQREVLRLYHRRYRAKEIAARLGISENTVSGYLTEAAGFMALGRQATAAALVAYEADHPEARGRFSVGEEPPATAASIPSPAISPEPTGMPPRRTWWLPVRQGNGNDLTAGQRLAWIVIGAAVVATSFGLLAIFIRTVSDIVSTVRQ